MKSRLMLKKELKTQLFRKVIISLSLQMILFLTTTHRKPRQSWQGFNNIYAK